VAARLPETAGAAGERFPLAARALRRSTAVRAPATRGNDAHPAIALPRSASPRNWALYLFLFLLPLQNLQTGYIPNLGGGLNFLNVMFIASLFGAWLARGELAPDEPVNRWILAYAAYGLVSLLVGYRYVADASTHWTELKDQLVAISICCLVQASVRDWAGARRILVATLLPLPYIAWVAWSQHASVAQWHYSDDLRIGGTFSLLGANEFAAFCVTMAVVMFALLLAARMSLAWRVALGAAIACMLLGVLFAYSRTAYISLMLGVLVVLVAWHGRWKLLFPALLAVALLPSVLPRVLPQSVVERFDTTTVDERDRDESIQLRFEYWQTAWELFKAHPLLGTGFHTFHHREVNPAGRDTHSLYMRTLSEGGLLGALVLAGLLLAVLRTALRELLHAMPGTWHHALALGLLGAWVSLVCSNLFGDRFTYYPMIACFWAYVALVAKARHLGAARRPT
jgi:O-antigen ligase